MKCPASAVAVGAVVAVGAAVDAVAAVRVRVVVDVPVEVHVLVAARVPVAALGRVLGRHRLREDRDPRRGRADQPLAPALAPALSRTGAAAGWGPTADSWAAGIARHNCQTGPAVGLWSVADLEGQAALAGLVASAVSEALEGQGGRAALVAPVALAALVVQEQGR